jgi:glutamine amidotransferase
MMKVHLLDLGLGNLLSLRRGFERAGAEVAIVTGDVNPTAAAAADALVLPGVGGFRDGSAALGRFREAIGEVRNGKPLLGICLGMQLLFSRGFEGGEAQGLDLIKGEVVRLPSAVKVPHMGWNSIRKTAPSRILGEVMDGEFFYFVHSYHCVPSEKGVAVAEYDYGVTSAAVVEKGNIFGTQFHPEKSGEAGRTLLKSFIEAVKR